MRSSKKASSDDVDLKEPCEKYKEHLERVIRDDLSKRLAAKGLLEVVIQQPKDIKQFGDIRSKFVSNQGAEQKEPPELTADDLIFIADKVIKRDPPAEFRRIYPALTDAVLKYRVVNALLKNVSDFGQFRVTYLRNFQDLIKDRDKDPSTQIFLNRISRKLGVYAPNLAFFSAPKAGAANDQAVVSVVEKPKTPRSNTK
jgi:hypothetical protein